MASHVSRSELVPNTHKKETNKFRNFVRFIWNPRKKQFLGRTGTSFAKILLFYACFYIILAAMFATMLKLYFWSLSSNVLTPRLTGKYSSLRDNPGMAYRPIIDNNLITFRIGNPNSYMRYVHNIAEFLKDYETVPTNAVNCSDGLPPPTNKVCTFNLRLLGNNCSAAFGYSQGRPCVLLKVNKVFGWKPVPFDSASDTLVENVRKKLGAHLWSNYIGVTCEGAHEGDMDNIGQLAYYPAGGFSYNFFPYLNTPNYSSPLVFVQFIDIKIGSIVEVWCRLWTSNIKHYRTENTGSVHFNILIDK